MLSSKAPSGATTNGSGCPETRRKAQLGHRTTMIVTLRNTTGTEDGEAQSHTHTHTHMIEATKHTALGDGVWAATVRLLVTSRIAAVPGGWTRPCMHHAMHTCDHILSHRYRWWRSYCVLCTPELSASSWTGCILAGGGGGEAQKGEGRVQTHKHTHRNTQLYKYPPHTAISLLPASVAWT